MEHTTTNTNIGDIDPDVYARRWRILAVLCLSLTIIMIANGSLNVALPTLAHDLHASTSSLQWMVDTYALVFAGLLFTAGTLGDRFGRKRALQAGLMLFLVGAAVAVTASSASTLIVARGIMGVAAAFVMPSTLSILTNVFPAHERIRVHHPLQRTGRCVQVMGQRREGDVEAAVGDHDDRQAQAQDREDPPPSGVHIRVDVADVRIGLRIGRRVLHAGSILPLARGIAPSNWKRR